MQTETNGSSVSLDERIAQLVPVYGEERAEQKAKEEFAREERKRKAMAPPGALKLPPLLEKKRLQYEIPDACFGIQPVNDRVFAYQIASKSETYKGSSIIAPDTTRDYEARRTPVMVILNAGLRALDELRSNGIDLGHTVVTNQMVPYRVEVGLGPDGRINEMMLLRTGEICGSEELAQALQSGVCKIIQRPCKDADGNYFIEHVLQDESGKIWQPELPWIADDQ